jgi:hypothetical protein
MADNKNKKGRADRRRVNIHQDYEVRYRKRKFGVSEEKLRDAVKRVGDSAQAVEREVKNK